VDCPLRSCQVDREAAKKEGLQTRISELFYFLRSTPSLSLTK
jgi:hypothetical protein